MGSGGRIDNRVGFPDGTAAVSAEAGAGRKSAIGATREGSAGPQTRKSEDLLEIAPSTSYGQTVHTFPKERTLHPAARLFFFYAFPGCFCQARFHT